MQVGKDGYFRLTYCSNIHPGNGWGEVEANLRRYAPPLKARLAPDVPFGLGLRLSDRESRELLEGDRLARFQEFLAEHDLYVFLINGFPYGPFHNQTVKEAVFAPDWREEERVDYTLRLAEILSRLLPAGVDGGISTSPLSYKAWVDSSDPAVWEQVTRNVVRVAAALGRLKRERGTVIHLDIEPEPDGLVETSAELARFFAEWLLPVGAPRLAEALGVSIEQAREELAEHVRVCWDTCHMSVAYERPAEVLERYEKAGLRVGRVQVSAALKVATPGDPAQRAALQQALEPLVEPTYLHQVRQRAQDGSLRAYPDLDRALPALHDPEAVEWRTHFHVPIFVERYGAFCSTQDEIQQVLTLLSARRFTPHLEIETYTWQVLPPVLKRDLVDSIEREYGWVRDVFPG